MRSEARFLSGCSWVTSERSEKGCSVEMGVGGVVDDRKLRADRGLGRIVVLKTGLLGMVVRLIDFGLCFGHVDDEKLACKMDDAAVGSLLVET